MASVFVCSMFIGTVSAANYYVDVNHGKDSYTGSAAHPWKTINHAAAMVKPGSTVSIAKGIYPITQNIHITTSATKANPIIFKGVTGTVIDCSQLDGSDYNKRDGIFIENANHVTIENLEIKNSYRGGIRVSGSDYVTIRAIKSHNNGNWGIFTDFCDHILIEKCDCYGSKKEHGVYISNSGDYPILRGNKIHANSNCGLHMNGDISMGGDGIITGALVENNIIFNNGVNGGSGINCDGVQSSTIRNNLLFNNHASGISLYKIDGGAKSINNKVYQNTIIVASDGRWALNLKGGSSRNYIYNNILLNKNPSHGSISTDSTTGLHCDYNILTTNSRPVTPDDDGSYPSISAWHAMGFDKHSKRASASQIFVNYSNNDYRLKNGSVATDCGTSLYASSHDIRGLKRPQGNCYDIGAYEYLSPIIPLKVISIKPSNGIRGIPINIIIKISFNRSIKMGNGWIELKSSRGVVTYLTKKIINNMLILTPKTLLHHGTKYTVTLHTGSIRDLSGHRLGICTSTFTTKK